MKEQAKKLLTRLKSEIDERIELTENGNLPISLYSRLAFDESSDVRFHLASNANIPIMILQILAEDENVYVAHRAKRTIQRIESEIEESQGSVIHYGQAILNGSQSQMSA